eukprot:TRINITY_DN12699_c0_g1_i1.p1 TRINITY_DN12699_c0_g1~~TRINITY_DN12699_c0_g1_i1.p1  ORF type:complete len:553 (+),score=262.01 TRINITY_DN12699_c0_g1_i1:162-1820(+)
MDKALEKEERRAGKKAKRAKKSGGGGLGGLAMYGDDDDDAPPPPPKSIAAQYGYTNEVNPFGDSSLTETFHWAKKGAPAGSGADQTQMLAEINKAKQRREEREIERAMLDDEKRRMIADADGLTLEEWEARGQDFEVNQLVTRARNRLKERRVVAIDLLLFTVRILKGFEPAETLGRDLREITKVLAGLSIGDLKTVVKEVDELIKIDGRCQKEWVAVQAVAKNELQEHLQGEARRSGVHADVQSDVAKQFAGKTLAEVEEGEREIKAQLQSLPAGIDQEFWDTLLKQVAIFKSKALLKDLYNNKMKDMYGEDAAPAGGGRAAARQRVLLCTEDSEDEAQEEFRRRHTGRLSPPVVPISELSEAAIDALVGEKDDLRAMVALRASVWGGKEGKTEQESLMRARGDKLTDQEELFDETVDVKTTYSWHDRYRPRKPKYFNKMHTGYSWNRYNATHYDVDNPPPKQVMGYKFNISYPDLADKTQQPAFFVEPTSKGWNDDRCVLRFTAGPPYEDVAFLIVNKEWDKNWRAGYKCTFDRGVMQLHFQFVRYRYRR